LGAKLFDLLVVAGAWSGSATSIVGAFTLRPTFSDEPRGFLPAFIRSDGAGHSWSAH
jgi:hypothetical protein